MRLDIRFDLRMRKHCEHELALYLGERFQKFREIFLVECPVVVSAGGADIRRVDKVECSLAVVPAYEVDSVLALHSDI